MTVKTEMAELRAEVTQLREQLAEAMQSRRKLINARTGGQEHPDPTPIELPVGYNQPPTLTELVQQHVRGAMSNWAAEQELGTFEEEDDFEPQDEDLLPMSGFEVREYEMEDEIPQADAAPPESPEPGNEGDPVTPPAEHSGAPRAAAPGGPSQTEAPTINPSPEASQ